VENKATLPSLTLVGSGVRISGVQGGKLHTKGTAGGITPSPGAGGASLARCSRGWGVRAAPARRP